MSGSMREPCGCELEIDDRCGALHSILKCDKHKSKQREITGLDAAYYGELGAIDDNAIPPHIREFEDAFGKLDAAGGKDALEIGAGASRYVPMILDAGYSSYNAIEPSAWACEWLKNKYPKNVWTFQMAWEDYVTDPLRYDMILSAHSLERMIDAPSALQKMADHLNPGGRLFIVIPDDSDLTNPDHLWFFNKNTLDHAMELAGLTVEIMKVRKIVAHENFIFCMARKPA